MEGNAEVEAYRKGYTEALANTIYSSIMHAIAMAYVNKKEILKILDECRDRLIEKIKIDEGK